MAAFLPAASAQSTRKPDDLVALCTPGLEKSSGSDGALALYPLGFGKFGADEAEAGVAQNCEKATGGNLGLKLGELEFNLTRLTTAADSPAFTSGQGELTAKAVNQPLCESYFTGTGGYALVFRDSNGDAQGPDGKLRGITGWRYNLADRAIEPQLMQATYGPWLRCFDASLPNAALAADDPERVFKARFESTSNVVVELLDQNGARLANDQMLQTIGANSSYKVRVSNQGEGPANGLRIREFLPKASGALTPAMTPISCSRDTDQQSCAAGDGTLEQEIATLAPGESVSYSLTRKVEGTAELAPLSGALTSVAAFVNPAQTQEAGHVDNARSLRIGLVSLPQFTVTASAGAGGSVSPTTQPVTQGTAAQVTVTPAANYQIASVSDDCGVGGTSVGSLLGNTYTVPGIVAACAVNASFELVQHAVSATGGNNGTIAVQTPSVAHGGTANFSITVDVGFSGAVSGNAACGAISVPASGGAGTAGPITGACALSASFSQNQYTVTPVVSGGNGTISPSTPVVRAHGDNVFFMLDPAPNHQIATVTGCGGNLSGNTYLIASVTANCTVTATFALITHPVTVAALSNGSIIVTNSPVPHSQGANFTVTPATGYHTVSVSGTTACGALTDNGGGNWSTGPIIGSGCELSATFAINQYAVDVSMTGSNGTIGDPAGTTPVNLVVNHGATAAVRATPAIGHHAVFTTTSGSCAFTDVDADGLWEAANVGGDCAAIVTFAINQYSVTAALTESSPPNSATVTVLNPTVNHGTNSVIEVAVASGHHLTGVPQTTCNSITQLAAGTPGNPGDPATYRVNVTANCSLTADVVAD